MIIKSKIIQAILSMNRPAIAAIGTILLLVTSIFTPIFSQIGLFFLQRLPEPPVVRSVKPAAQAQAEDLAIDHLAPSAYVVLGGGLRRDPLTGTIQLNKFTQSRLQSAVEHYQNLPLPIVLSGVESPWMQEWLAKQDIHNVISESASMNTCENARFTAKRLNLTQVYLVTDPYHMSRARRQFALNGIKTVAINAPLCDVKSWLDIHANYRHSKRTVYEVGAYLRDIFIPQSDCRRADEVSLSTLMKSRKPQAVQTF